MISDLIVEVLRRKCEPDPELGPHCFAASSAIVTQYMQLLQSRQMQRQHWHTTAAAAAELVQTSPCFK